MATITSLDLTADELTEIASALEFTSPDLAQAINMLLSNAVVNPPNRHDILSFNLMRCDRYRDRIDEPSEVSRVD